MTLRARGHMTPETGWVSSNAMDEYLDHLETTMTLLAQRDMTDDQVDRFARILAAAEADAIRRVQRPRRVR